MNILVRLIAILALACCLAACAAPASNPVAAALTELHPPQNFSQERLDDMRDDLSDTYQNATLPLTQRVEAFDALIETFDVGTPVDTVLKYVKPPPPQEGFSMTSEEPNGGDGHKTMTVTAPDGSILALDFYEDLEHGIDARIAY